MRPVKSKILYVVSGAVMLAVLGANAVAGTVPPDSTIFPGLKGAQLMDSLELRFRASSNLGYDAARDTLYGKIDKDPADSLRCIYSGYAVYMQAGQDPSTWAYDHGLDCEHTWPQSSFNQSGLPRADMHHLYACQRSPVSVNGDRGDSPFSEIPDGETDYWYYRAIKTSTPPDPAIRDQYSELDNASGGSWEVREQWAGNVSRGLFYFYNMYRNSHPAIETWWQGQLPYVYDLLAWHVEDPADAPEIARTKKITTYQQGKVNPYILDSTLVRRAYFPNMGVEGGPGALASGARLLGNVPNPFQGSTVILYSLPGPGRAEVVIYNVLGLEVARLAASSSGQGERSIAWNARSSGGQPQPPGIYFYQLKVGGVPAATRRMLLVR